MTFVSDSLPRLLLPCMVGTCLGVAFAWGAAAAPGAWSTQASVAIENQSTEDLDSEGEFDVEALEALAIFSRELNDSWSTAVRIDVRAMDYDFGDLPFEPWDYVHRFRLIPRFDWKYSDEWALIFAPILDYSGQSGADVGDSLRAGAAAAVKRVVSDDLTWALGLMVTNEIEDDAVVLPFVLIDWQISPEWRFATDFSSPSGGPALRLSYAFQNGWEVAFRAGLRRERFRLDDDRPTLREDGVGEDEATLASVHVSYALSPTVKFDAYVGSTIDGELRLEDERGNKIFDTDYDDAVFWGLKIHARF